MKQFKFLLVLTTSLFAFSCSKVAEKEKVNLVESYIPQDGLVAYYTFSGNANDEKNSALNGELFGPTLSTDRASSVDKAFEFSSDYIKVPNNSAFNFGTVFTASVWIKTKNPSLSQKIFGRANGSFNGGFVLGLEKTKVFMEVFDNTSKNTFIINVGNAIVANEWTHLAITWKSGGNFIAYTNGIQVAKIAASANPIGSIEEPLIIGGAPWIQNPLNFPFSGSIDDVGLWNREFTASEILSLYNSSK
ncbi:MAG: LamG domain-containing protein [Cytophagales bacterium]